MSDVRKAGPGAAVGIDGARASTTEVPGDGRDSRERVAFPVLGEPLIDRLRAVGAERSVRAGDVLWSEGDRAYDFFVVLDGAVRIVETSSLEERTVTVHHPGEFTGDVDMLTGRAALVTARVDEDGRVLHLSNRDLKSALAEIADLGDVLLEAFLMRRVLLIESGFTGLKIIGSRFSRDTHRLTEFAARNRVPYTWLDLEEDEQAEALLQQLGVGPHETPVVIGSTPGVLRNPSNQEIAELTGLRVDTSERDTFDLVVVGAGPGGLAASVYGASEGLYTIAVESKAPGGQAGSSSKIENYLGFPSGLSGEELTNRALLQAQKFGADVTVSCPAVALRAEPGAYVVALDDGTELAGRAVVIATGAEYRKLDIPGLDRFEGLGVFYAATETEARLCSESNVVVVGGGNSAGQAAVFLSSRVARVYVAIRGDDLGKSMSRYLVDRIERTDNIEVLVNHEVVGLGGDDYLDRVELEDNHSGERTELGASGLFLFIGASPRTEWLAGQVLTDAKGFLLTGEAAARALPDDSPYRSLGRPPHPLETSLPGVFAVGDVRAGSVKRVASAVGEGSMAVRFVHQVIGA